MGKPSNKTSSRKASTSKEGAPSVPPPHSTCSLQQQKQHLIHLNRGEAALPLEKLNFMCAFLSVIIWKSLHGAVKRRIAAIRAIRDAQVEGILTQLRLAQSKLSDSILDMPLGEFLKTYCPGTEAVKMEDNSIELRKKKIATDCPSMTSSFEFQRDHHGALSQNSAFPTPREFPFSRTSVKEQLLQSIDMYMQSEEKDEEWGKILASFKETKAWESLIQTPQTELRVQSKFGITPRTERLPKRGEILMSIHGSPLGLYESDKIAAIPEERPKRARRKLGVL